MSLGFHDNTCSCGIGYLFSLDTALVYTLAKMKGTPCSPNRMREIQPHVLPVLLDFCLMSR
jgi:hypothetical protein